jgi:Fur family zinc uptake transcriptional regulator
MNSIHHIIEAAEQHCKAHGARLTTKRKQVLSGLLASEKALSAYELADYCGSEFGNAMPAMSVYRILDFLKEEGLIHELKLAHKYVACSHISCNHEHEVSQFLICDECQRVEEITVSQSTMRDLELSMKKAGYQLQSPQIEMNCLCEQCSTKTN